MHRKTEEEIGRDSKTDEYLRKTHEDTGRHMKEDTGRQNKTQEDMVRYRRHRKTHEDA